MNVDHLNILYNIKIFIPDTITLIKQRMAYKAEVAFSS